MKTLIALAVLSSGCAFKTLEHGEPVPADTSEAAEPVRPCGRALSAEERAVFLETAPLYDAVWAVSPDGAIWHADRARGVTHRLVNGVDTVIQVGGSSVKTSESGRVIVTSLVTNSVYEIVGTSPVLLAGNGKAGHVDGDASAATFDMPYGITLLRDGALTVHDVGNLAIRLIQDGRVTTVRCTAKD